MDWPLVLGAVASGGGAIALAGVSIKLTQKEERRKCDARIGELDQARKEGIELGREASKPKDPGS
jgi:hypothetical protein